MNEEAHPPAYRRFFAELRRRKVFQAAGAYGAGAFVLLQVVDRLGEGLRLPDTFLTVVTVLAIVGFPIALVVAWAFERTPDGLTRTDMLTSGEVDELASLPATRRWPSGIIALIGVSMFAVGLWLTLDRPGASNGNVELTANPERPGSHAEVSSSATPATSIAVLPFVNMSEEESDAYFSDGLAEEILNLLAQSPDLKVTARTSSFALRDEQEDVRRIGELLGVAHVLEGSIRRSGDRLRITAQLIRASDGFHLWSQTYERAMTDIFEIQDDIVRELIGVLQIRLGVGAGSGRARSHDVETEAYEAYLQGLHLWANRHSDNNRLEAIRSLRLATEIDPDFADASAAYALSMIHSPTYMLDLLPEQRNGAILDALNRALEVDPDAARAHAGLALYYGAIEFDLEKSLYHVSRATELAPNAAATHYASASAAIVLADYETARI